VERRGSRWKCANTRRRSSSSTAWPIRPDQVRNTKRSRCRPARRGRPARGDDPTSGQVVAVVDCSGGTPRSMPRPMRNGPGQPGRVLHGDVPAAPTARGGAARAARRAAAGSGSRRKTSSPAGSSSASSVAHPRQSLASAGPPGLVVVHGHVGHALISSSSASSAPAGRGRRAPRPAARVRADGGDPAVLQQRDPVGQQHRRGRWRRPARWSRPAPRAAPPRPAPRCARRAPTAGRRAPAPTGGRAPRGPAPAAAAGRRTATCPARRSGCPGPTAGRARTRPGRPAAPPRRRRRWRRAGRG
jgi:hypothetical protein